MERPLSSIGEAEEMNGRNRGRPAKLGGGVDRIKTPHQRWTVRGCGSATCVVDKEGCFLSFSVKYLKV